MKYEYKVVEYLFKIAREDKKYNFHFVPFINLSQIDHKAKLFNYYNPSLGIEDVYYKIYINNFEIDVEDKRKRSLSLSLKPGRYNIKVKAFINHALGKAYERDSKFSLYSNYHHRYVVSDAYWCKRVIDREMDIVISESNEVYLCFTGHLSGKFQCQRKYDFYEPSIMIDEYSLYDIVEGYSIYESNERDLDAFEESWSVYSKFRYEEVPLSILNEMFYNNVKKEEAKPSIKVSNTSTKVSNTSVKVNTTNTINKEKESVSNNVKVNTPIKPINPIKELRLNDGTYYKGLVNSNGNYEGKGYILWPNGDSYEGEFKEGYRHGKGTYKYKNGNTYTGDFIYSKRTGKGVYTFKSGERYEGEFKDNKFNGTGTYYFSNGEYYEGEFKDGLKHGKGSMYDNKGRLLRYGKWINDVYDNPYTKLGHNYKFENALIRKEDSVLTFSNSRYVGLATNGIPDLIGTYYYNNDDIYSGVLYDGVYDSFGTYIFRNGSYYIGRFSNGKYNGFGLLKTVEGFYYFGHFADGLKNGVFLEFKNRECAVKIFNNDKLVDLLHREYGFNANIKMEVPHIPIYLNKYGNDLFIGEKDSNGINGFGILKMDDDKYIGHFNQGSFDGIGAYVFDDGEFMLGQFVKGEFTGLGVKYLPSKREYIVGKYKNNELISRIK